MDINWAHPLTWVAVYVGALVIYAAGLAFVSYYHLLIRSGALRTAGKVLLVSIPVTATLYGVRSAWQWFTVDGLQSILDWMGWVTANVVIVSGIGLAWLIVALSARVSWEEWYAAKKDAILTRGNAHEKDEPLLDIGPVEVASDFWQEGDKKLADLIAVVQEWKVGRTESTLSAEDDTLELPVIPDVIPST